MNPPANLPFEPLPPPPARASSTIPPPPPTPPVAPPLAPAPTPMPKSGVAEPEDIFSNMEKPGGSGLSMRPAAALAPEMIHHVSYGRIFTIIAVVLLVVAGAGFAFWWFVIRTPVTVPIVAPPTRPTTTTTPTPPAPVPAAPAPLPVVTPTPEPTPILPPVTTPPDGVSIPLPTSVTNDPPPADEAPMVTQTETDADGDGLSDRRETELGLDPAVPDSDVDGVSDGDEVIKYGTNPLNRDTDRDTYEDGAEIKNGYNPRGEGKCSKPDCIL